LEESEAGAMSDNFAKTIMDNPHGVLLELCKIAEDQTKKGNTQLINQLITAVQIVEHDNKEKENVSIQKET
jgi:hypothetical protein